MIPEALVRQDQEEVTGTRGSLRVDPIAKLTLREDDRKEVPILLMKGTLMVPLGEVQCHPILVFRVDLLYQL